jgi:nucleotide-binding universal stress UspA family protein
MSADVRINTASYAVVMAAFDLDMPARGVLTASARLAGLFDARVIGVAAAENSISPYFAEGPIADKYIAQSEADLREQLKSLQQQFRETHAARRDQVEWRVAERLPDGFMIASARAADLIVTARPSPNGNLMHGPDVANLVMQAGRPVLVVPSDATSFSADRVLVAWKDTREARRAVSDALPLLAKGKEVHVVAIPEPESNDAATLASADDVVNWLARHGVQAAAIARPDLGGVGKSIEHAADEIGADIIVAGAFGHSRFMEWLLGGVTRHLLRSAKACVLFSH